MLKKVSLSTFIHQAQQYGLPVRFLAYVNTNYNIFSFAGWEETWPTLNTMWLSEQSLNYVQLLSFEQPQDEARGIEPIYHECTHAYFDLKSEDPKVRTVLTAGQQYYRSAPLKGGGVSHDETRLVQEAAAEYVGHRVSRYWLAAERLFLLNKLAVPKNSKLLPGIKERADKVPSNYNRAMAERTFGYEYRGSGKRRQQVQTRRVILPDLRRFCDGALLERTIPDKFGQAARLMTQHGALNRKLAQLMK